MITALLILLIVFLLYAFAGIFAFAPYLGGLIGGFFRFLLDLVKFNIYPVGEIVYIVYAGLLIFFIFLFIINIFHRGHN